MIATTVLLLWLLLAVLAVVATARWSRRLWRLRKELPLRTRAVAAIFTASAIIAALGSAVCLARSFAAVRGEGVDPAQKARELAEGISGAMNFTAFGIIVGVPSAIVLGLLSRNRREQRG